MLQPSYDAICRSSFRHVSSQLIMPWDLIDGVFFVWWMNYSRFKGILGTLGTTTARVWALPKTRVYAASPGAARQALRACLLGSVGSLPNKGTVRTLIKMPEWAPW